MLMGILYPILEGNASSFLIIFRGIRPAFIKPLLFTFAGAGEAEDIGIKQAAMQDIHDFSDDAVVAFGQIILVSLVCLASGTDLRHKLSGDFCFHG